MQALPMMTPSVVRNARTLLAQRASNATIQVSFRIIMEICAESRANHGGPHSIRPRLARRNRFTFSERALIPLPPFCCADRATAIYDSPPSLPNFFPEIRAVSPATRRPPHEAASPNCPAPWPYTTSTAIPPRWGFPCPLPATRRDRISTGGHPDRSARPCRWPPPFFRRWGGRDSSRTPQSKRPRGRNPIPEFFRRPRRLRPCAFSLQGILLVPTGPGRGRSFPKHRYGAAPCHRRRRPWMERSS